MKRTALVLALAAAAFSGSYALANDSAMPFIPVDSIETNVKLGSHISFTGAEAAKLMKILPKVAVAGNPDWAKRDAALLIQSPGYNVVLSCSDIDWNVGVDKIKTPSCNITFTKNSSSEPGDKFVFEPSTQCEVGK